VEGVDKADSDDPKKEPNTFSFTDSVTVQKPVAEVFEFLVEDMPTRNAMFATGQESFELTEEGEIVDGSVNDSEEAVDDQEMLGRFELKKVPIRFVYISFFPTSEDVVGRLIRKMSVYSDLEKMGFSETLLTMTYVVHLTNFWVKLFARIIGVRKLLAAQLTEDLHATKSDIETGDSGASSRLA
jgi:hypothetical protein